MNPVAAVLLGVTTAVGGGLLRDITANEVPQLFNPKDIYALPAFAGAVLTAVLWVAGAFNVADGVCRCRRGLRFPGRGLAPLLVGPAGRTRLAPAGPGTASGGAARLGGPH